MGNIPIVMVQIILCKWTKINSLFLPLQSYPIIKPSDQFGVPLLLMQTYSSIYAHYLRGCFLAPTLPGQASCSVTHNPLVEEACSMPIALVAFERHLRKQIQKSPLAACSVI